MGRNARLLSLVHCRGDIRPARGLVAVIPDPRAARIEAYASPPARGTVDGYHPSSAARLEAYASLIPERQTDTIRQLSTRLEFFRISDHARRLKMRERIERAG